MNTERIRQEFGSFGIDIIECSEAKRIASLYSLDDGRKVCRTWAQVEFRLPREPALANEHARVLSGHPIGAIFKAGGWAIHKRHIRIDSVLLGNRDVAARMQLDLPARVALHSYVFEVTRKGRKFDYATITEMHHPDYLDEAELRSIFRMPDRAAEAIV